MSQYARKDPPWSHVGAAGLNQTLVQQNQSLLGAQPGVVATPTTNVYGQSMVASGGIGAGGTTAYPSQQQALQQRQTLAIQQQQAAAQNAAAAAAGGAGAPQLTVSYPTTRSTQGGQPRQRVFTGTVTKLHDTFGFVDEDVFFQTNTVKGSMPKIGDRVLVEATYNASMPFKWNATRIQMLNSPMEQQVQQPPSQQQQHAIKMQQLKQMQQQPNQRLEHNVAQQFKVLKSQQPLLKAPQQGGMMSSQPAPPGLLGNPPPLLQQPPPPVVQQQQQPLLQGNPPTMQNLAGAYAHASRASQLGQQAMPRRDFVGPSRERERDRDRDQRERDRAQRERERERDREHRERERERERERRERDRQREREKSPVRKRSRSPRRSKSPRRSPRRTKRVVQRYVVQIPRFALDIPRSDVIELHKRYTNMYIPSDFFLANFKWQEVFPIHRPMNVAQPCSFHVMHKEAPPPQGAATVIDPPDANYAFCAKVMLMTSVSLEELYERCCGRAQDSSDARESFQHPTRLINFLIGQKGKNEVMAIGGPWSPSLDGADPVNNSAVLIKTAIRTTKALTGIDLSSCTQWYRFLELNYHRPEENHKGRVIPARVETVVIFVPDVWHILPTKVEWENVVELYKKTLSRKMAAIDSRDKKPAEDQQAPPSQEEPVKEEEEEPEAEEPENQTPTNWKELDPKNMKVNELRQELEIRGLNSKGLKSQLIARLTKTLKAEQETEDAEGIAMETEAGLDESKEDTANQSKEEEKKEEDEEEKKKEKEEKEKKDKEDEKKKEAAEDEKKRQREREKRELETRYALPETPSIMVHPSAIAKSGKFDCAQQSLSVLLDYRVEDNKEHSFEVFLFAELFNEMLQRDFSFNMYKALCKAPERKEEKKEDKKKDKDKKDDREKDKKEDKKEDKDDKKDDKKEEKEEPRAKRRKTEEKDSEKEEGKDKEEEKTGEDAKEEEKEGEEEENDSKSNEEEAEDGDEKKKGGDKRGKDEKSKTPRVKQETLDPQLLLSCIYFDQNHCGYILERDLEEILYTIGIHLSRAQVRKLLQKVIARDCWNYRKMTDGVRKEKEDAEATGIPTDEELGRGNQVVFESMTISKKNSPKSGSGGEVDPATMVKYGGTVIDVANLLKQVQRADQERSAAHKKIEELEKNIDHLKSKASSSEATVTNVSGELQDVQKRLSTSERALLGSTSRSKRLIDVIGSAQKNLDEIMLKFNEVLEEALLNPMKVEKEVKDRVKVEPKVDAKVKAEPKVKVEPSKGKVEKAEPKTEK